MNRIPMAFDGLLDKILAKARAEPPAARIHYCSYWGTYSRVLSFPEETTLLCRDLGIKFHDGSWIELNLTPVNLGSGCAKWDNEVRCVRIRDHGTSRDRNDRDMADMPSAMRSLMVERLGPELTERLLTEDFMSQIDLFKLFGPERRGEGGKKFEDIKKV